MKIIITGGGGFIGANAASRYLQRGHRVILFDDFSRPGSEKNLTWLKSQGRLRVFDADIRNADRLRKGFQAHRDAGLILHLAAQVAVTTSVQNPRLDFEINALGTFNVLEAVRHANLKATFLFASTNKVYGEMEDLKIIEKKGRYAYAGLPYGVPEERNLDFHSPYGCSKGAADQYVRDYHRIYGIPTIVFRQSCIYGPRQFGVEDQGWVAWFMIAAQLGRPLTIYGDGKQVRDVLYITDLLDAFDAAAKRIRQTAGRIYNIGGGPRNTLSLLELVHGLESRRGRLLPYRKADWRPGDQRIYVSDIRRARKEFGWKPKVGVRQGLGLLYRWVSKNQGLFR